MKKLLNFFSFTALAASVFLSSCSTSTDPKPAPTIDAYFGGSGTISYTGTGPVTVSYAATAGEEIKQIDAIATYTDGTGAHTDNLTGFPKTGSFTSSTTDNGAIIYTFTATTPITVTFTVTDKKGNKASKAVYINQSAGIATYTAKLLGAQKNTAGSYFASVNGTVYLSADALLNADKVDITFAQIGATSSTTKPTLISPDYRDELGLTAFVGGTITYFNTSTLGFDALTAAQLTAITGSAAKSVEVVQGGIYEFVNAAGKKGLIKVTNYTPGSTTGANAGVDGSITIDVKVQQ
jgi:hypothetical protein